MANLTVLSRFFSRNKPNKYPLDFALQRLLNEFVEEISDNRQFRVDFAESELAARLLALPDDDCVLLVCHIVEEIPACLKSPDARTWPSPTTFKINAYETLANRLLRKKLPFPEPKLATSITTICRHWSNMHWRLPWKSMVSIAERLSEVKTLESSICKALSKLASKCHAEGDAEMHKYGRRIDSLVTGREIPILEYGWPWVQKLFEATETLPSVEKSAWERILRHSATATTSRPSKKWQTKSNQCLSSLGEERFSELFDVTVKSILQEPYKELPLSADLNSTLVRGLVWFTSLIQSDQLVPLLHELGEYSFRKIADYGPGSSKVGNAVIYALGALPDISAISGLTALKARVKYRQAQNLIDKALSAAAEARGLSVDTLEEMAVPTLGFEASGMFETHLGEYRARMRVGLANRTDIVWFNPNGKQQKTAPKPIRDKYPIEIKQLRRDAKEVTKVLNAQRARVERMMLRPKVWSVRDWKDRYLNHPLMQHIARKLIWKISIDTKHTLVFWCAGKLVDVSNTEVSVNDHDQVTIWHPIGYTPEQVLAWRRFLESNEITQPFKQAHREVYLITDAERETEIYSNRFAGHILRQHQMASLCRERGWEYQLQGAFDSHNYPTLRLPEDDLVVQYFCDAIGDDNPTSDSGIFLYVSTDQVKFTRSNYEPVRLEDVPPILLSESLRNVDLFVGVCSIGNDPNWADGGYGFTNYWQDYAFGELSTAAKIRSEVLTSIIPKLTISEQLKIDGRFLVVTGGIRVYKIHIGSGNIMMEPNNQYLCIVQGNEAQSGKTRVLLPFEGDGMLSVILSKAVLLAADTKIKDKTILNQLKIR